MPISLEYVSIYIPARGARCWRAFTKYGNWSAVESTRYSLCMSEFQGSSFRIGRPFLRNLFPREKVVHESRGITIKVSMHIYTYALKLRYMLNFMQNKQNKKKNRFRFFCVKYSWINVSLYRFDDIVACWAKKRNLRKTNFIIGISLIISYTSVTHLKLLEQGSKGESNNFDKLHEIP